jgi:hypothetical protein
VALKPHSENPELGAPDDYREHHPEEHPGMWGWHAEFGRFGWVAGVVVIAITLLMITSTQYNHQGTMWLIIFAVGMAIMLAWQVRAKRNSWRR